MKKMLASNLLVLSSVAFAFNAFAAPPKEAIEANSGYDKKGTSISVQGVGNKVLEQAFKSKYLVINRNDVEYAYSIRKLGSGDVKYVGKQSDIDGLVFLEVIGYKDGKQLNNQLTVYRPSKYKNAIYLEKFDRNENRPYQFDLSVDSGGNVMIINKLNDVTYLTPSDKLKAPVSITEKGKKFVQ
ncbi:hypothetical protein [Pseudomonas rhodesiae]|uniref:hypothetical protein n=1 Tax=Pseudomonas rhodesiae TaxID=76760 RepID=UPI0028A9B5E8|nr:hypothetical protein [Pseudomonas rhodesiae]